MISLLLSLSAVAAEPVFEQTRKDHEEVKRGSGELSAEAGGSWVSGNSSFYQLNAKTAGGYKWGENRISGLGDALWGKGFVDADGNGTLDDAERAGNRVETARRVSVDLRYDRFFGERNSLYVLAGALIDAFAGYDLRTHEQLGYSRHFVAKPKTSLIGEAGLDLAQENYVDGVDPNYANVFAAREMISFKQSVGDGTFAIEETIEAFENLIVLEDVRVNNTLTLSAKLSDKLSVKASDTIRWDNDPVEGFRKLDQLALITLVATFLATPPAPAPPPPPPCPCEEEAAAPGAAAETPEAPAEPPAEPAAEPPAEVEAAPEAPAPAEPTP